MTPAEQRPDRGPAPFACPHYAPAPGGKRCRDYLDGGPCARPDTLMCVEWLRANGHPVPPASPTPTPGARPSRGR